METKELDVDRMRHFFEKILAFKVPKANEVNKGDANEVKYGEENSDDYDKKIKSMCTNLPFLCTLCKDEKIDDDEKAYKKVEKQNNGEINLKEKFNTSDKRNYIDITINEKNMHEDKTHINQSVNSIVDIIQIEGKIDLNLTNMIKHSVESLANKCLDVKPIWGNCLRSCDQCESKAKWKLNLIAHCRLIHGQVDNPCDGCEHKATWKSPLKYYTESVHGILSYSCYQCEHKAKWQEDLKTTQSQFLGQRDREIGKKERKNYKQTISILISLYCNLELVIC